MKNYNNLFTITFFALASLSLFLVSCSGPHGPQGPQGEPGYDGNANVWSINYIAESTDWYDVGTPGQNGFYLALDFDVPEINADIVENGLVLIYYRADSRDPWKALPYTVISHSPDYIEKLDFIYSYQFVGLQSQASDKNGTPFAGDYRIIVASALPVNKRAIDHNNYNEVVEWLGITEEQQITR